MKRSFAIMEEIVMAKVPGSVQRIFAEHEVELDYAFRIVPVLDNDESRNDWVVRAGFWVTGHAVSGMAVSVLVSLREADSVEEWAQAIRLAYDEFDAMSLAAEYEVECDEAELAGFLAAYREDVLRSIGDELEEQAKQA